MKQLNYHHVHPQHTNPLSISVSVEPEETKLPLYQIYDEDLKRRHSLQLLESVSGAAREKLIKNTFLQELRCTPAGWCSGSSRASDSHAVQNLATEGTELESTKTSYNHCGNDETDFGLKQLAIRKKPGSGDRYEVLENDDFLEEGRKKLFPLWKDQDKIIKSGLLETMDEKERKLQETLYEVFSSEHSYFRSLNLVISRFFESQLLRETLLHQEHHTLFSNIVKIRDTSKRCIDELVSYHKTTLTLERVPNILLDHLPHFECYVSYCANNQHQLSLYMVSLKRRQHTMKVLQDLEKHPDCQRLDLMSFLMLPLQRITKLPLLLKAILDHSQSEDRQNVNQALEAFTKLAKKCNDEAERMMQIRINQELMASLTFKDGVKHLELSQNAIVKKKGAILLLTQDLSRLSKNKLVTKRRMLVITSEKVIIAKERMNGNQRCCEVQDWCLTNRVSTEEISESDREEQFHSELPSEAKCVFLMTFLVNNQQTKEEYILCTEAESDMERWIQALTTVSMRISACLDCPRVFCIRSHVPEDIDEIRLDTMDQLDVLKKMEDGWWEGRKLQDGSVGWFPASHVREIDMSPREAHKRIEMNRDDFKKRRSFEETDNVDARRRNKALYRRRSAGSISDQSLSRGSPRGVIVQPLRTTSESSSDV